jgi:hypothetical protein
MEYPWTWVIAGVGDNWYGNWGPQDKCFRSHISRGSDGYYRVHAWGNDDIGMVMDVPTLEKALEVYGVLELHAPVDYEERVGITAKELEELGFEWF